MMQGIFNIDTSLCDCKHSEYSHVIIGSRSMYCMVDGCECKEFHRQEAK